MFYFKSIQIVCFISRIRTIFYKYGELQQEFSVFTNCFKKYVFKIRFYAYISLGGSKTGTWGRS